MLFQYKTLERIAVYILGDVRYKNYRTANNLEVYLQSLNPNHQFTQKEMSMNRNDTVLSFLTKNNNIEVFNHIINDILLNNEVFHDELNEIIQKDSRYKYMIQRSEDGHFEIIENQIKEQASNRVIANLNVDVFLNAIPEEHIADFWIVIKYIHKQTLFEDDVISIQTESKDLGNASREDVLNIANKLYKSGLLAFYERGSEQKWDGIMDESYEIDDNGYFRCKINNNFEELFKKLKHRFNEPKNDALATISKEDTLTVSFNVTLREIILNDLFLLAQPNEGSENHLVFKYLYNNPNRKITREELQVQAMEGANLSK